MSRTEHFEAGVTGGGEHLHPNVETYRSGGIGHIGEDRSVVAMLPTHTLEQYREHDGNQNSTHPTHDRKVIDGIRADIRSGVGIKEPLMVEYDHDNKWGALGEGNHRLAAAREEGISHVPVRVYGRARKDREMKNGVGAPLHLATKWEGGQGEDYVPPAIHPLHFKQFKAGR